MCSTTVDGAVAGLGSLNVVRSVTPGERARGGLLESKNARDSLPDSNGKRGSKPRPVSVTEYAPSIEGELAGSPPSFGFTKMAKRADHSSGFKSALASLSSSSASRPSTSNAPGLPSDILIDTLLTSVKTSVGVGLAMQPRKTASSSGAQVIVRFMTLL